MPRNPRHIGSLLLSLCLWVACATTPVTTDAAGLKALKDGRQRTEFVAESPKSMIVTAHPLATQAGLAILQQGGNAVDAAIAASLVISVVRPQSTGIGGGGFLLYFDQTTKQTQALDFRERAPAAATVHMFVDKTGKPKDSSYQGTPVPQASLNGHLAVGTPGLIDGLLETHRRWGSRPLPELMAPAIKIAREGFPIYPELARSIKNRAAILGIFPSSKKIFFRPNGEPKSAGDQLVQEDLARTLTLVSQKGRAGFYEGVVAKQIVAEMQRGKGLITLQDLKNYRTKVQTPVRGTYRGYEVVSMPPPSSGGVHLIQMLNMLENYDLSKEQVHSPTYTHILAEVMRRAYADRAEYLGDPAFVRVPVNGLTNKKYANSLIQSISPEQATPSSAVKPGNPAFYESASTTHISVVDPKGNAVATTQTINYTFGSGVVAEGTGVVLNDEMDDFAIQPGVPNVFGLVGSKANAVAANKTMLSSMTPTLIFNQQHQLDMILGSPGGSKIITAVLQTVVNHIDFKLHPLEAVHTTRIHHQWSPDILYMEEPAATLTKALTDRGYKIENSDGIGDVQAIFRDGGQWIGVADARSTGTPAGQKP